MRRRCRGTVPTRGIWRWVSGKVLFEQRGLVDHRVDVCLVGTFDHEDGGREEHEEADGCAGEVFEEVGWIFGWHHNNKLN